MKRLTLIIVIFVATLAPANKMFAQCELISNDVTFQRACGDSLISYEAVTSYSQPVDSNWRLRVDRYLINMETGDTVQTFSTGSFWPVERRPCGEACGTHKVGISKWGLAPNVNFKLVSVITFPDDKVFITTAKAPLGICN